MPACRVEPRRSISCGAPTIERVGVADQDNERIERLRLRLGDRRLQVHAVDVADTERITDVMQDYDACLSAVHYWFNVDLTRAAIAAGTHFCDLGGNNTVVGEQLRMDAEAHEAGVTVVPDCGLAPGMANVLAAHGDAPAGRDASALRIRVGGLPQHPRPPLDYQLVFAVEGLINEYVERCIVIRDGVKLSVEPLTEIESLEFPEPFGTLEAFHTSGGLSTLAAHLRRQGARHGLQDDSLPGPRRQDADAPRLGLVRATTPVALDDVEVQPRALTARLFGSGCSGDGPDVVLVRVTVIGTKNGGRRRLEYEIIDHYDAESRHHGDDALHRLSRQHRPADVGERRIETRGVVVQERCRAGRRIHRRAGTARHPGRRKDVVTRGRCASAARGRGGGHVARRRRARAGAVASRRGAGGDSRDRSRALDEGAHHVGADVERIAVGHDERRVLARRPACRAGRRAPRMSAASCVSARSATSAGNP